MTNEHCKGLWLVAAAVIAIISIRLKMAHCIENRTAWSRYWPHDCHLFFQRLQQELVELRNSYQDDEGENYLSATNVFADEYVEEEKFNAQHSFTIRGNRNSPHDSGISSASETSWRTSNMSSYSYSRTDSSSIVNSRYSQSPMETASNTMRLSEDCEEAIYGNNTQC